MGVMDDMLGKLSGLFGSDPQHNVLNSVMELVEAGPAGRRPGGDQCRKFESSGLSKLVVATGRPARTCPRPGSKSSRVWAWRRSRAWRRASG